ncbi:MAG: four helix bundle protein [Bacteroidia bacterium]
MTTIKRFEDLEIWQASRELCKKIFALTEEGIFAKDFGLKGQIKNSSGSVMDNIAEGFGRGGNKEFTNFLSIAIGSCCEVQSQLNRALDWKYISEDSFKECYTLSEEIISKTGSLINYLNHSDYKGEKFKNNKTNNDKQQQTTNLT